MSLETIKTPVTPPEPETRTPSRLRQFFKSLWPLQNAGPGIAPLDGLRGIAVLLTIFPHLLWGINDSVNTPADTKKGLVEIRGYWDVGWSGVTLFFVLSGFLLFIPYARAIFGRSKYPSSRKFYVRRALRILPAYWVSLVLILIFLEPQFLQTAQWLNIGLHFTLTHNWSFETRQSINAPYWTMAVESQFYVLLPVLGYLLYRLGRAGKKFWFGAAMLALAATTPAFIGLWWLTKNRAPALFEHVTVLEVFGFLGVFVTGMACSTLYIALTETDLIKQPERIRAWCRRAGPLGIAGCLVVYLVINIWPFLGQFRELFYGFCFGGIVLATLVGWESWAGAMSRPLLRVIGIISYSLYIWNLVLYHHLIIPIAELTGSLWGTILVGLALVPLTIFPFAWLFYHFVERPFIKVRKVQH